MSIPRSTSKLCWRRFGKQNLNPELDSWQLASLGINTVSEMQRSMKSDIDLGEIEFSGDLRMVMESAEMNKRKLIMQVGEERDGRRKWALQ